MDRRKDVAQMIRIIERENKYIVANRNDFQYRLDHLTPSDGHHSSFLKEEIERLNQLIQNQQDNLVELKGTQQEILLKNELLYEPEKPITPII